MTLGEGLVWAGNAFYFSRFLVQWLQSEREKRSATPRIFWWISLFAVAFSLSGTLLQASGATAGAALLWVLVPAFLINAAVYARNLMLTEEGSLGPVPAALIGLVAAGALIGLNLEKLELAGDASLAFLALGVIGQSIFASRFVVQWFLSEKRGHSHFPLAFWWLSLVGALFNLTYTIGLQKPEFVAAYVIAWFVPLRNILLEKRRAASPSSNRPTPPPS